MSQTIAQKRARFRELHEAGCFLIPNPFDVGTARYLQSLGVKALASTSSGAAWTKGLPDNALTVEAVLQHLGEIAGAVDLPVNADFEGGFAIEPEGVAANVARAVSTGIAGLSIEDSTGDPAKPLYDRVLATARIRAARAAIDASDASVLLTGRAENYLVGKADLGDVIDRLTGYAEAGADVLYAPGLKTREDIAAVVKAVAPKPVNVLMSAPLFTVQELADLGVRRISIGGALARAAWGGVMRAAREMVEKGSFAGFADAAPNAELNALFKPCRAER